MRGPVAATFDGRLRARRATDRCRRAATSSRRRRRSRPRRVAGSPGAGTGTPRSGRPASASAAAPSSRRRRGRARTTPVRPRRPAASPSRRRRGADGGAARRPRFRPSAWSSRRPRARGRRTGPGAGRAPRRPRARPSRSPRTRARSGRSRRTAPGVAPIRQNSARHGRLPPAPLASSAISAGTTVSASPTTPRSACWKIGASGPVDRDDAPRVLHADDVLRGAADADGDVDVRLHRLAGLSDLHPERRPARRRRRAASRRRRRRRSRARARRAGRRPPGSPSPRPPATTTLASSSLGPSSRSSWRSRRRCASALGGNLHLDRDDLALPGRRQRLEGARPREHEPRRRAGQLDVDDLRARDPAAEVAGPPGPEAQRDGQAHVVGVRRRRRRSRRARDPSMPWTRPATSRASYEGPNRISSRHVLAREPAERRTRRARPDGPRRRRRPTRRRSTRRTRRGSPPPPLRRGRARPPRRRGRATAPSSAARAPRARRAVRLDLRVDPDAAVTGRPLPRAARTIRRGAVVLVDQLAGLPLRGDLDGRSRAASGARRRPCRPRSASESRSIGFFFASMVSRSDGDAARAAAAVSVTSAGSPHSTCRSRSRSAARSTTRPPSSSSRRAKVRREGRAARRASSASCPVAPSVDSTPAITRSNGPAADRGREHPRRRQRVRTLEQRVDDERRIVGAERERPPERAHRALRPDETERSRCRRARRRDRTAASTPGSSLGSSPPSASSRRRRKSGPISGGDPDGFGTYLARTTTSTVRTRPCRRCRAGPRRTAAAR